MTTYIYFVKCPGCEDEHFDFFDEAKEFAMSCMSKKPIITQTEVNRNDFGECTDSCDLGTVWSWEDLMGDTEPTDTRFSKNETFGISEGLDDFDDFDIGPQIDEFDNSLDFDFDDDSTETLWVAENLNGGEIVAACWADSEDLAHRLLSQAFRERTGGDLKDCYIREAEADEPDYITDNPELLADSLEEWINTSSQGPYVIKVENNADGYNYEGNGGRSLVRIDSDKLSIFNSYDAAMKAKMGYKNPKSVEIMLLADEQKLSECRKPIPEVTSTGGKSELTEAASAEFIDLGDGCKMSREAIYDTIAVNKNDIDIPVGNLDLSFTDVSFNDGGYYSDTTLNVSMDKGIFYITEWHHSDDGDLAEGDSFEFRTFEEFWDKLISYVDVEIEECARKPIPEGMTIEQLVEEMEANEDTVECVGCEELFDKKDCFHKEGIGWLCGDCEDRIVKCGWCEELYDRSECRREVDFGWLCSRCEMGIKSRGETLTFREGSYWDFLDEDITAERSLEEIVRDSINHLVNDLGKDHSADDFADEVIGDIERNYDIFVPETPMNYRKWADAIASEVSRQLNNPDNLTEASLSDIAAAANSEFGTNYNERDILDSAGVEDEASFDDIETQNEIDAEAKRKHRGQQIYAIKKAIAEREAKVSHDLGNEYDGGYPESAELLPEVDDTIEYPLTLCPECGRESFYPKSCACISCGFNALAEDLSGEDTEAIADIVKREVSKITDEATADVKDAVGNAVGKHHEFIAKELSNLK